jgi:hypothetical protein
MIYHTFVELMVGVRLNNLPLPWFKNYFLLLHFILMTCGSFLLLQTYIKNTEFFSGKIESENTEGINKMT